MKKMIAILLIGIMTMSLLSACSSENDGAVKESTKESGVTVDKDNKDGKGSDESNVEEAVSAEPAELSLYMHSRDIQDDSFSKTYIEEATNTKLSVTQVTTAELENKLNILLASGERPDLMNFYTDAMEDKLAKGGVLLPLNEYFDAYPELKASRSEEVWETMRHPDGNIYSIGYSSANPLHSYGYRADWLDKFGMDVPSTLDEYYDYAVAVATQDPDGNGEADTYAMGGYGKVDTYMDHIFGAYGALPNFWHEVDGKIVSGSVQPGIKDAVTYLNRLYEEGLMDPEFVTDNSKRWKTKVKAGVFGGGQIKIHLFDKNNLQNYYAPFIESNPDGRWVQGKMLLGGSDNPVEVRKGSEKGWVRTGISAESEDIDAALRLLTFGASEEGNKFINYGIEGTHYEMNGDLVEKIMDSEGLKNDDIDKFYIAKKALFDHSSPELHEAIAYMDEHSTANPIDGMLLDEFALYEDDLIDYTNNMLIAMIIGDVDIESGFDAYVQEWYDRGGQALLDAINAAY